MELRTSKLFKNISISVFVQALSLITGFVMNLLVPKIVSELDFSYWQSYVLYVSYVSLLHFGLVDGFILKYSKYDYDTLDKDELRSQIRLASCFLSAISAGLILYSAVFQSGATQILLILLAIGIITKNLFFFTGVIFQITYRINKYAASIIVQRATALVISLVLIATKTTEFYYYVAADIIGDIVCGIYCLAHNKELFFGKCRNLKSAVASAISSCRAGITLLLANFSSSFIIGGAKMAVQSFWGALTFGKVSFSLSITSLFSSMISAVSIVLFPALKRIDEDKLPITYEKIRAILMPITLFALIMYYPGKLFLAYWLPNYYESLNYLPFVLPMIVFTAQESMLNNNYYKILRKEKAMFAVNVASVVSGCLLYLIFSLIYKNLYLLLLSILLISLVRSVASEAILSCAMELKFNVRTVFEILCALSFLLSAAFLEDSLGIIVYAVSYFAYLGLCCRRELAEVFKKIIR